VYHRYTRNEREERKTNLKPNSIVGDLNIGFLNKSCLKQKSRTKVIETWRRIEIVIPSKEDFFFSPSNIKHFVSQQNQNNFHLFIPNHPVNLSILFTGGRKIKRDIPSNGEWKEWSAKLESERHQIFSEL
jgi:hypothetical protein